MFEKLVGVVEREVFNHLLVQLAFETPHNRSEFKHILKVCLDKC